MNYHLKKKTIIFLVFNLMLLFNPMTGGCQVLTSKNAQKFLGTWVGSIDRLKQNSSDIYSTPIILRFHYTNIDSGYTCVTQITDYQNPKKIKMDKRIKIGGTITSDSVFLFIFNSLADNCNLSLPASYTVKNGVTSLRSHFTEPDSGCYKTRIVLKKINNDTTEYPNVPGTPGFISSAPVTSIPAANAGTPSGIDWSSVGTSIKQHITLSTDKKFKWFTFNSLPDAYKKALGLIHTLPKKTLLEQINKEIKEGCDVAVALIDLDNNGIYGFAVFSFGNYCCGSQGCSYEVWENGGLTGFSITDYDLYPGFNSIRSTANRVFRLAENKFLTPQEKSQVIPNFRYQPNPPDKDLANIGSGGGTTPEELGQILLRALKTNDLKMWMSCVHPEADKDFNERRFKEFRQWLEENGVSDWNLVKFDHVDFTRNGFAGHDDGVVNGEQARRNYNIDFTYQNDEFVGGLGHMTILTYNKGGRFLIWFPGKDTAMTRKKHK